MHELQLALGDGPKRPALEAELRAAIRAGRLVAGTKLPSTRLLASDLGIARSTVVDVYEQLVAEGFLRSRQGVGTVVAEVPDVSASGEEQDLLGPTLRWDFRPGEPDLTAFPRTEWLRSLRRVVGDPTGRALTYADPRGARDLRVALTEHLGRTRAVATDPSGVFVTGGFAAGLGFVAEALRTIGVDRVAVEEAMLPMHRLVLRALDLDVAVIPVDDEGIVVAELDKSNAGAVLVTPANHYPYGVTMSPARRSALVAWAERTDGWIIEDDYDGEFRYDRRPIGALQGFAPHRVVYGGTASKSLAPGLRLGWLAVPGPLREPLLLAVNLRAGVSTIDQAALVDFIDRGHLDRQIRKARRRYEVRRTELADRLTAAAGWARPAPCPAGLHLHVPLASPEAEAAIVASATQADVGLLGLAGFHRAPAHRAGIVIGFSRPSDADWAEALDRLVAVIAAAGPARPPAEPRASEGNRSD